MKHISIGGIICVILAGFFLLFGAMAECGAKKDFPDMEANMVEIEGTKVLPENEGKLVVVRGDIKPIEAFVTDSLFGVSVRTTKLVRIVEMLQWEKDRDNEDYSLVWSNSLISITALTKSNPRKKPYEDAEFACKAKIGEFEVSEFRPLKNIKATESIMQLSEATARAHKMFVSGKYFTNGKNVGSVRVSFQYVEPALLEDVTVLGMQKGNSLVEYSTSGMALVDKLWTKKMSKDKIMEELREEHNTARLGGIILTLFLGVLGVFLIKAKQAPKKNQK